MEHYNWSANAERGMSRGVLDYVNTDGIRIRDIPVSHVLVRGFEDLSLLSGDPPGTSAFTADGKHHWMKAADGAWNDWLDDQASI